MSYKLIYGFYFYNLILSTNKLTRSNYVDWKINLYIVLTSEELKWATQELTPSHLNEHFI